LYHGGTVLALAELLEWSSTNMEPSKLLIDSIYTERVLRARATSPESKLLDGPRLFDYACRIVMDGIRNENPAADDHRVREILRNRLALRERLERSP
jgi:hypothetical protein